MNVVASWHVYGTDDPVGPLDVWLIDEGDRAIHITTGSDWCLVVETSEPYAGYDMGDSGHITVGALNGTTPFERHIGECSGGTGGPRTTDRARSPRALVPLRAGPLREPGRGSAPDGEELTSVGTPSDVRPGFLPSPGAVRVSRAQALSFSPGQGPATPLKEDRALSTHASTSSAVDGKHLVIRADDAASSSDVSIRTTSVVLEDPGDVHVRTPLGIGDGSSPRPESGHPSSASGPGPAGRRYGGTCRTCLPPACRGDRQDLRPASSPRRRLRDGMGERRGTRAREAPHRADVSVLVVHTSEPSYEGRLVSPRVSSSPAVGGPAP